MKMGGGVSIETRGKINAGGIHSLKLLENLESLSLVLCVLAHLCALNCCGCLRQPNIAALNKKDFKKMGNEMHAVFCFVKSTFVCHYHCSATYFFSKS